MLVYFVIGKKLRKENSLLSKIGIGALYAFALIGIIASLSFGAHKILEIKQAAERAEKERVAKITAKVERPEINVMLLTVNPYSRPGIALPKVNNIVVHYTANPGTTAEQNRNYFENLKDTGKTKASSHFIIGIDGEIVQCIPTSEISYASNDRNGDTLSIECCHKDKSGKFTKETYDSLIELLAFLCGKFDLTGEDIIRHYDVTGKSCPKYYVDHEKKWLKLKQDVDDYISINGVYPDE